MVPSLTAFVLNCIGQLPKPSGYLVAVQPISLLAAYLVERHYVAFSKDFEVPRNNGRVDAAAIT